MGRYVFPPSFDYLTYPEDVDPVSMYIFEFEHALTRKGLTDMWQNLPPDIGRSFKTDTVTIQHKMLESEFFRCEEEIPDKLRWMVFKVKKKARKSYSDVINLTEKAEQEYGYNWPYDFCSLVELARIESETKLTPEIEDKELLEEMHEDNKTTDEASADDAPSTKRLTTGKRQSTEALATATVRQNTLNLLK